MTIVAEQENKPQDSSTDVYADDWQDRIQPDAWCSPRVIVASGFEGRNFLGAPCLQKGWAELSRHGELLDTTLRNEVLVSIEKLMDAGQPAGVAYYGATPFLYALHS